MDWEPSVLAVVLVLLGTTPIAVRRQAPAAVLGIVVGASALYALLEGQPEPDYLATLIAIYTVAASTPRPQSHLLCGAAGVIMTVAMASDHTVLGLGRGALLVTLVWALGIERRETIESRTRVAEERARQQAERDRIESSCTELRRREWLARRLHDSMARSLTRVVLAGEAARTGPRHTTETALDSLVATCREALGEVRTAVVALDPSEPATFELCSSWEALLEPFRRSGLRLEVEGNLHELAGDDAVASCARRIVHEGLTNALRHAGCGCWVHLFARVDETQIALVIVNDLRSEDGAPHLPSGGYGLSSLQRDVTAAGGRICFGAADGVWTLRAEMPRAASGMIASSLNPSSSDDRQRATIEVVIVDDETVVRQALATLVGSLDGLRVVREFSSGEEVLAYLDAQGGPDRAGAPPVRRQTPGWSSTNDSGGSAAAFHANPMPPHQLIVLLDLVMPDMDGFEVIASLRRSALRQSVGVLVLTSHADDARARRAVDLGADGIVLKDSSAGQLLAAIRAVADGLAVTSSNLRSVAGGAAGDDRSPAAVGDRTRRRPPDPTESLTRREREVYSHLADGLSNRAIARELGVAERTVKVHVSSILSKLGVASRTQAALLAPIDRSARSVLDQKD